MDNNPFDYPDERNMKQRIVTMNRSFTDQLELFRDPNCRRAIEQLIEKNRMLQRQRLNF